MNKAIVLEKLYNILKKRLREEGNEFSSEIELENKIKKIVKETSDCINAITLKMYLIANGIKEEIDDISENDYKEIEDKLLKYFQVNMEQGTIIQGKNKEKRDLTWWTSSENLVKKKFYWDRYKEYINKKLSSKVISAIDADTDKILNNIGDPKIKSFKIYGLVIGHVQSGKTSNYSGVICKAADAGYKVIVVITGTLNNLRSQTQNRLNEAFVGRNDDFESVGVGLITDNIINREKAPRVLTTEINDFSKEFSKRTSLELEESSNPVVLVIKKNVSTLKNLNNWLDRVGRKKKIKDFGVLVIDDESDYASINTNEEEDPTSTNKGIRTLLSHFEKSSYIAYTATPYANILIDHETDTENEGRDLFPKDFIFGLKAPNNYCGAEKIFIKEKSKFLRYIKEDEFLEFLPSKHKSSYIIDRHLPNDLIKAIITFYLNICIRKLKNQVGHNSMLIHITRFTEVHGQIRLQVEDFCEKLNKIILTFIKNKNSEKDNTLILLIKEIYLNEYKNMFSWEEIKDKLYDICKTVLICGEYMNSDRRIEYSQKNDSNIIAIGGTSLSRGFTLEGLSVSYFVRNSICYDTLMQMGRWFGYRQDYEELCKVYMLKDTSDYFEYIHECTVELIKEIDKMHETNKTPEDFGLSIMKDPKNALQITAKNKQKNAEDLTYEINFKGELRETIRVPSNKLDNIFNEKLMINFIETLPLNYENPIKNSKTTVWKNINKQIILNFISEFKLPKNIMMKNISYFNVQFLEKYIEKLDVLWDVAIYSGDGKEKRIGNISILKELRPIFPYNDEIKIQAGGRVASGASEAISLEAKLRKKIGSNSSKARKYLKKPLLMLHFIEPTNKKEYDNYTIPAFGISFPENSDILEEDKKMRMNSVMVKQIKELIRMEDGND